MISRITNMRMLDPTLTRLYFFEADEKTLQEELSTANNSLVKLFFKTVSQENFLNNNFNLVQKIFRILPLTLSSEIFDTLLRRIRSTSAFTEEQNSQITILMLEEKKEFIRNQIENSIKERGLTHSFEQMLLMWLSDGLEKGEYLVAHSLMKELFGKNTFLEKGHDLADIIFEKGRQQEIEKLLNLYQQSGQLTYFLEKRGIDLLSKHLINREELLPYFLEKMLSLGLVKENLIGNENNFFSLLSAIGKNPQYVSLTSLKTKQVFEFLHTVLVSIMEKNFIENDSLMEGGDNSLKERGKDLLYKQAINNQPKEILYLLGKGLELKIESLIENEKDLISLLLAMKSHLFGIKLLLLIYQNEKHKQDAMQACSGQLIRGMICHQDPQNLEALLIILKEFNIDISKAITHSRECYHLTSLDIACLKRYEKHVKILLANINDEDLKTILSTRNSGILVTLDCCSYPLDINDEDLKLILCCSYPFAQSDCKALILESMKRLQLDH